METGSFSKKKLNFWNASYPKAQLLRPSFPKESDFLLLNLESPSSSEIIFPESLDSNNVMAGWCPQGNGCPYSGCEKVWEYETGGCPNNPDQKDAEEENLYINWGSTVPECSNIPGYTCKYIRIDMVPCWNGSSVWQMLNEGCDGSPPEEEECIHSGHGEGIAGFEFECTDGIDNDCDDTPDCMEDRCAFRPDCIERCDKDRDEVKDEVCRGQDCHPENPNLPGEQNPDGEFTELICSGGIDEDCDGFPDCRDDDCNSDPVKCPQCDTDNDGLLSEVECNGSDCKPDDPARPTGVLNADGWHERACSDGVSNDCDEDIDCADPDCAEDPACAAYVTPTPPTSTPIGGGEHCWIEIYENDDCCPWDPSSHTCYGCDPIILINCN